MNDRFEGCVALVFGAGSAGPGWSNGKASAVTYARGGAYVVVVDINEDAAIETKEIIESEGGSATCFQCDVTNAEQVEAVVSRTVTEMGQIDILHNNVGHAAMGGPVELSEADWQRELDLNLKGIFLACKYTLPIMEAQNRGAIINISSIAGLRYVGYNYASYYAAKGAVNQMTVGLALQYAKNGIRVNAICPGLIDTPMIYQQISDAYDSVDEMVAARHAQCPTGHMGTAWDVANAAAFLASDDAHYITAVILPVDGGMSARAG